MEDASTCGVMGSSPFLKCDRQGPTCRAGGRLSRDENSIFLRPGSRAIPSRPYTVFSDPKLLVTAQNTTHHEHIRSVQSHRGWTSIVDARSNIRYYSVFPLDSVEV